MQNSTFVLKRETIQETQHTQQTTLWTKNKINDRKCKIWNSL